MGISIGFGAPSDLREVTIVAAPAAPTGLRAEPGDEQVKLTWKAPTGDPTPVLTGYQYQQNTAGVFGDDWTDIPGSTTSHFVTGLANGTEYFFRVRSVNVTIGSTAVGPESATPSAAGSRPARPTNFNAEQNGVGQVELTWDAAPVGLTVTGYQYTDNGGSDWTDISGSDSGTTSHTVSDLTPAAMYTFAVRAVNSGTLPGLSSVPPRDVTIIDVPNMPTGLGTTSGDTQATFHWNVTVETTDRPIDKQQLLHLPQSRLTADDGSDNDEFGYSVAIDGTVAVVGAPKHNGTDTDGTVITDSGAAYVFVFTEAADADGVWSQAAKLTASVPAADDKFGYSVAVNGSTVVVGAHQHDVGTNANAGAAYVFTKPETNDGWKDWDDLPQTSNTEEDKDGLTAKLTATDDAAGRRVRNFRGDRRKHHSGWGAPGRHSQWCGLRIHQARNRRQRRPLDRLERLGLPQRRGQGRIDRQAHRLRRRGE